jgi:hypothetical protein
VTVLIDGAGHGWLAPLGWQAAIIHPEPPPPSGGGPLRRCIASLLIGVQRGLLVPPAIPAEVTA